MRRPLIAGNWKMHTTVASARALAAGVVAETAEMTETVDVVVGPPFTALAAVAEAVKDAVVGVAAQDMHWAGEGAFTGEVSPRMAAELARYVILGHSERRAMFCETDVDVHRKVHAAFANGLLPIVCVGETLAQRDADQTDEVVTVQLCMALDGIAQSEAERLLIAYEPVWAIGTGRPCDPEEADRVGALIRTWLSEACGFASSSGARILYGGSVKPENARSYFAQPNIDGALVGGASLDASSFAGIVRAAL